MRPRYLPVAILALGIVAPSAARAAVTCYDESSYPSVIRLDKTETGLRAFPGIEGDGSQPQSRRSVVLYNGSGGWEAADFACNGWSDCNGYRECGEFPGPAVALPVAEAIAARPELAHYSSAPESPPCEIEQKIGAWTERDGAFWFGIQFYDGEGVSGVGGLGRFDPKTGQNIVRRPPLLRELSVFQIVHDGRWLWLAVGGSYECLGIPPSLGLVRYDWNEDRMETFAGREDAPCGFTVNDLLLDEKYLWVATDLGLSRRDREAGTWEHFVPVPGATPPMQPTTCEAIYTRLLETLPSKVNENHVSPYSQLIDSLGAFRPHFVADYAKSTAARKACDDLFSSSARVADFSAFKKEILDVVPPTNPDFECALEGFGEHRSHDPEWRDFLLARLDDSPKQQSVTLALLENFAPDAKIGDALARRLATSDDPSQEAKMLPSMIGEKSVPLLMAALDRFRQKGGHEHIVQSILVGLMRATNKVIWPDGKETKLLTESQPQSRVIDHCEGIFYCYFGSTYAAATLVAYQWRSWWQKHEQEFSSGRRSEEQGSPSLPGSTMPTSGTLIDQSNDSRFESHLSPSLSWLIQHGAKLKVGAYRQSSLPKPTAEATAQYAGNVELAPSLEVENYVAGLPFAKVEPAEPFAAAKLMLNFERANGVDDMDITGIECDTDSSAHEGSRVGPATHYSLRHYQRLNFTGRLYTEKKPTLPSRTAGAWYKEALYPLIEPFDQKGAGVISFYYLAADKPPDSWLYLPQLRRVRRISSAQRSEPQLGQDIDLDSFNGFAGQVASFEWQLIGEKLLLSPFRVDAIPVRWNPEPVNYLLDVAWEPRSVWVIESRPRLSGYLYSKRVIYLDRETYRIVSSDLYDSNGELWKSWTGSFLFDGVPDGGNAIASAAMIDMRAGRRTACSIPGSTSGEGAYYLNEGDADENTYEICGSITPEGCPANRPRKPDPSDPHALPLRP